MARKPKWPPTIHHRRGQDYIKVSRGGQRREYPLGPTGSREAADEYARLLVELQHTPELPDPDGISVQDVAVSYMEAVEIASAGMRNRAKRALRGLNLLHGRLAAAEFGPEHLKSLQRFWAGENLSRQYCIHLENQIREVFRWAAEHRLVPIEVHQLLSVVKRIRKRQYGVRESPRVELVEREVVESTLPFLPPVVADLVRIQLCTGCRPAEACAMRPEDIDREWKVIDGVAIWLYRMDDHKNDHRGKSRWIPLGPKAQAVLEPYMDREGFCFSPRETLRLFREKQRQERKSKVQPSQADRRKTHPRRLPGERYTTAAYSRRIRRVCLAQGIEPWSPGRIRHLVATEVETEHGREGARCVLGHSSPTTTAIYAESVERAARVIAQMG